ncbi:hypothetical protein FOA52_004541 [Chlamydomonas sp. UWO 241]|nr:hypothetical protein FOA52_004541 [Chlamydomonas sp. UWO 241]
MEGVAPALDKISKLQADLLRVGNDVNNKFYARTRTPAQLDAERAGLAVLTAKVNTLQVALLSSRDAQAQEVDAARLELKKAALDLDSDVHIGKGIVTEIEVFTRNRLAAAKAGAGGAAANGSARFAGGMGRTSARSTADAVFTAAPPPAPPSPPSPPAAPRRAADADPLEGDGVPQRQRAMLQLSASHREVALAGGGGLDRREQHRDYSAGGGALDAAAAGRREQHSEQYKGTGAAGGQEHAGAGGRKEQRTDYKAAAGGAQSGCGHAASRHAHDDDDSVLMADTANTESKDQADADAHQAMHQQLLHASNEGGQHQHAAAGAAAVTARRVTATQDAATERALMESFVSEAAAAELRARRGSVGGAPPGGSQRGSYGGGALPPLGTSDEPPLRAWGVRDEPPPSAWQEVAGYSSCALPGQGTRYEGFAGAVPTAARGSGGAPPAPTGAAALSLLRSPVRDGDGSGAGGRAAAARRHLAAVQQQVLRAREQQEQLQGLSARQQEGQQQAGGRQGPALSVAQAAAQASERSVRPVVLRASGDAPAGAAFGGGSGPGSAMASGIGSVMSSLSFDPTRRHTTDLLSGLSSSQHWATGRLGAAGSVGGGGPAPVATRAHGSRYSQVLGGGDAVAESAAARAYAAAVQMQMQASGQHTGLPAAVAVALPEMAGLGLAGCSWNTSVGGDADAPGSPVAAYDYDEDYHHPAGGMRRKRGVFARVAATVGAVVTLGVVVAGVVLAAAALNEGLDELGETAEASAQATVKGRGRNSLGLDSGGRRRGNPDIMLGRG